MKHRIRTRSAKYSCWVLVDRERSLFGWKWWGATEYFRSVEEAEFHVEHSFKLIAVYEDGKRLEAPA